MNFDVVNVDKWWSLLVSLSTIHLSNTCLKNNMIALACIGFIASMYFVNNWRKNSRKLKELKKYKILLENYNEFILETTYQNQINIFTIDNFSLKDIKQMKKNLKNREC